MCQGASLFRIRFWAILLFSVALMAVAALRQEAEPNRAPNGKDLSNTRPAADWPAWRKAMTEPNTIYDIRDNAITDIRYIWPGGEIPRGFATTDDGGRGTGATTTGYSGGVLLRGVGRWGVMPYGSGGLASRGQLHSSSPVFLSRA